MTVRFQTVGVDGLKVFYRSAGDPNAPVVLRLHGLPSASHMFRDLIPELAGKYRVVAPDLPGFGMAGRFAGINEHPLAEAERRFRWPLGRRPDDHPGLSDLGL